MSTATATLNKPRSRLRLRLGNLTASLDNLRSAATPTTTKSTQPTLTVPSLISSTSTTTSQTSASSYEPAQGESLLYSPTPSSEISRPTTTTTELAVPDSSPLSQSQLARSANGSTASTVASSAGTGIDDVFSLTDQMLADRFTFVQEIGFGNWGSVWLCRPKYSSPTSVEGKRASGGHGKVAVKLVHRSKTPTTAARVRALWAEMKIIRTLKHEPHPSIIKFEAFIITPSYALVVMEHLAQLMPVNIPEARARPYFRQLASAVGYLHERGITHNDIKPANVLLSVQDVPVLVDFGFAQKWDATMREPFLSSISWGTPEYLDPQRSRGQPHDERASDVWSLGVSMFEILIGRTPFEASEQEQFSTAEELMVYYERTKKGDWVGDWSMSNDMQHLLRAMISPDPTSRITALQTYHHVALQPQVASVITTPHFVRQAASHLDEEPLPAQLRAKAKEAEKKTAADAAKKRAAKPRKTEVKAEKTTSVLEERNVNESAQQPLEKPTKVVIKLKNPPPANVPTARETRRALASGADKENQDDTPTKVVKPAQLLKAKDHSSPQKKVRRRPAASTSPMKVAASARVSPTPADSPSKSRVKSKPKTVAAIQEDDIEETETETEMTSAEKSRHKERHRSHGAGPALADVKEVAETSMMEQVEETVKQHPVSENAEPLEVLVKDAPRSPPRAQTDNFPRTRHESPLATMRDNIIKSDHDKSVRFRTASGNLISLAELNAKQDTETTVEVKIQSTAAAANLDGRLDRIASWVKNVEKIVEDARVAINEGREPPLPTLAIPEEFKIDEPTTPPASLRKKHQCSPSKSVRSSIPSHMRTSSVQVEPSTPPKWMTLAEAEERVRIANEWLEQAGTRVTPAAKKERPTMNHVMKLFGSERSNSNNSRPSSHAMPLETVPLKSSPRDLRNHPSLNNLRSPTTSNKGLQNRHSESNLRLFATVAEDAATSNAPVPLFERQKLTYESFLTATPGIIRQGEGWGSLAVRGRKINKQSSMASLRDKARNFLREDRERERGLAALARESELSKEDRHRSLGSASGFFKGTSFNNSRPATLAGIKSTLTASASPAEPFKSHGKLRGIMTSVRAAVGIGKKHGKADEFGKTH